MNLFIKNKIMLLVAAFLLAGCGGASTSSLDPTALDGDPASVQLSMSLAQGGAPISKALEASTSDQAGTSIQITGAWLNVGRFEIELAGSCEDIDFNLATLSTCEKEVEESGDLVSEIYVQGPYVMDLMNGLALPELASQEIPSGIVKKVEIQIEEQAPDFPLPEGAPSDLLGHSLVVEGQASLNGDLTPVLFVLKFNQEMEFKNLNGVAISETVDFNEVLLTMDLDQWFQGIDLEACYQAGEIPLVDGVLVINEESATGNCSDIGSLIKNNINESGELEDDEL